MTLERNFIATVRPHEVAALLRKRGWHSVKDGETSAVWSSPSSPRRVLIPLHVEFDDYAARIADLFATLQAMFDIDAARLLHEIEEATHDTLRLRDDRDARWTTTLLEGRKLLETAHQAWVTAARSLARDEKDDNRKRERVQAFMEDLRLGQTERGSFILRVMAPIGIVDEVATSRQMALAPTPPFARKVTERMVRTFNSLADAATAAVEAPDSRARELFVAAAKQGVTSSLCEAVADAASQPGTSGIDVEVSFAGTVAREGKKSPMVRFDHRMAGALRTGANALRHHERPNVVVIEGWVTRLYRQPGSELGEVSVLAAVGTGERQGTVRVLIGGDEYETAIQAHSNGRIVRCRGDRLERDHTRFTLVNPREFRFAVEMNELDFSE